MSEPNLEYRIGKLELKPCEILILKTARHLTQEAHEKLRDAVKRVAPDAVCLVLDAGIELQTAAFASTNLRAVIIDEVRKGFARNQFAPGLRSAR